MTPLLRSWSRFAPGMVAILMTLGTVQQAVAQGTATCPIAATCTPGRASSTQAATFNMGILNVTVGNNLINKTSVGQSEGYQDNSCTDNAALVIGQSYAISVRTNPNTTENVRVWIDFNNDGAFTGNNELVFSSDNLIQHTGTITAPATATLGTRLRMRVAADFANGLVPTPCSTPLYSQHEDYGVTLSANASPPMAAFTTNATITCTGCVQFTDASQNLPTAWLWTFGDGTTSTAQNPNHCYTTAGTYAVTLRATNSAGTNTSAATSIVYNANVPVAASCTPQTVNYFANYGITRFELNTINSTSADGSAGYQDFTCTQRTELIAGVSYPMTINTGGVNPHDIRVYLDKNNDGTLAADELIYQGSNVASPGATTNLNLPTGTVLHQPLRLRVIADAIGNNPGPCSNPVSGQAEDYTVVARPNTMPPSINFSTNYVPGGCVNPVQFTDLTTNLPTSWLWDFGDGGTSTLQNPTHQYSASGTYNVTLSATNTYGTASITRLNAVVVSIPCLNYCPSNGTGGIGPGGMLQASPFWMTSVRVSNAVPAYTNTTGNATGGYASYAAQPIIVASGGQINLTVVTNLSIVHRTSVWVDWNTNGIFDSWELVADGTTTNGPNSATFTANFFAPTGTTPLNTRMRITSVASNNFTSPCIVNLLNAEVEDYQLRVQPLATREAQALPGLSLFPNPTHDGRLFLSLPDAKAAGRYTAEVQNLLGATVLRTALRLAPTADAELDLSSLAPGVYVLRLRDAQGQTAMRRVVRD
ncbi:GEVED domain-containing protein [Hymenobacter arizonensis]|uniref:Por secretion system C-terminal sorting domain-containing protein n=1 Tax=Hymenobacter arizonensis TaxID=1227077 RepID=A0A1I5V6V3_HYMAR|nr:GEVED domain-containing protein [Hymenobacter arizonensis]SFQ03180.1 Por secretion system C-terminal sorting domain-containing protein [Hymenobacter arizonensis]